MICKCKKLCGRLVRLMRNESGAIWPAQNVTGWKMENASRSSTPSPGPTKPRAKGGVGRLHCVLTYCVLTLTPAVFQAISNQETKRPISFLANQAMTLL